MKLFLVIARWRIPALQDLSAKLAVETNPKPARDLGLEIYQRLQLELGKPAALKGLKVGTLEFHNSGAALKLRAMKKTRLGSV